MTPTFLLRSFANDVLHLLQKPTIPKTHSITLTKLTKITKPLLDEESLLLPHTPSLSPKGIIPLTSGVATDSWAPVTAVVHTSSDLLVFGGGIDSCKIMY